MSNVPPHAPEPAEIASDLRYIVGQLARRTRERDIVTLPTRLEETLSFLDREGPMTTSELAERHSVRQQSMAAKLAELDAHGYLERQPHPTDRRKILIALSQDGRDRLNDDRRRNSEVRIRPHRAGPNGAERRLQIGQFREGAGDLRFERAVRTRSHGGRCSVVFQDIGIGCLKTSE